MSLSGPWCENSKGFKSRGSPITPSTYVPPGAGDTISANPVIAITICVRILFIKTTLVRKKRPDKILGALLKLIDGLAYNTTYGSHRKLIRQNYQLYER